MKKAILITAALLMFAAPAIADEYTVSSDLIGFDSGDGYFAPGSPLNPLIIRDNSGREIGRMESDLIGFDSDDGFFAPGGPLNPYRVILND